MFFNLFANDSGHDTFTNPTINLWSHCPSRTIIQFLCHKWAVTGDHADFVTASELGIRINKRFQKITALTTLCTWLDKEKKAYLSWQNKTHKEGDLKPITSRGAGLLPMLALIGKMDDEENMLAAKLRKEREHSISNFTLAMRAELKLECTALKDVPGFCTQAVQIIAADVYDRSFGSIVGVSWIPSEGWVLDFLRTDMNFTLRRITGSRPKVENMELTNKLHEINIEEVAYYKSLGFEDWQFVTNDEFGLKFFPTPDYKMAVKGEQHVYGITGDDKRQCTGNCALLGDGTLLGGLIIVEGKTDRVLPQCAKDPAFSSWCFDHTSNHWCDMRSKKAFISFLWQQFIKLWMVKKGVTRAVAERDAKAVFFQDCWAVNISKELREFMAEKFPRFYTQFIPFGRTGDVQINDVVFHHPLKVDYRTEANAWFLQVYRALCEKVKKGTITEVEKFVKLTKALCISVLREKMPGWLRTAVNHTLTLDTDGHNAVSASWEKLYFGPARGQGVLQRAITRREEAAASAVAKELLAAATAAAAAAPGGIAAAIEAGLAAGKAANAANQAEEAALSPLVVALAAEEIGIHEFDIPLIEEQADNGILVQRKSRATARYEILSRAMKLKKLEETEAAAQFLQAPRSLQPMQVSRYFPNSYSTASPSSSNVIVSAGPVPVPLNVADVDSDVDLISIKAALSKHTIVELKDMLKAKKLKVKGSKDILIGRLAEALTLDEGMNGGGDVKDQSAAKKQCRRKDDVVVELENDVASPGSGSEMAIPAEEVADAIDEAMTLAADEDDDDVTSNRAHANEDAEEESRESWDSDHEEEEYDSYYDGLF